MLVAISSAGFVFFSFVMFIVDAIGNHIEQAYSGIGFVKALYVDCNIFLVAERMGIVVAAVLSMCLL